MSIGTAVLLIVVGAVLRYAVTADVSGIDLQALGGIILVAGVVMLIVLLAMTLFPRLGRGAAGRDRDPL